MTEQVYAWLLILGVLFCLLALSGCIVALYELYRDRNRGMATYCTDRQKMEQQECARVRKQLESDYDEASKRG